MVVSFGKSITMDNIKIFQTLFFVSSFLFTIHSTTSQDIFDQNHLRIHVSDKLTTHLIFEDDIDYVDIGAAEFSVDKLKNLVKIKCTNLDKWNIYEETNLTIVTKGGLYYSLWVSYKKKPKVKTYVYSSEDSYKLDSFDELNKEKLFVEHCNNLFSKNANTLKQDSNQKMKYQINGIFYENDKVILRLKIKNQSRINFTTDSIRFLLTTNKKFRIFKKREALQYVEKNADFICNNTKDISAESSRTILFGFKRFVPTKNEVLEIRVSENNSGGRRGKIVLKIRDFLFNKD